MQASTKVFTALVLADMVRRGEVKLDDPVTNYLPADVHMPERDGKVITLVEDAWRTQIKADGKPVWTGH